jgi:hypothetical protein
MSATIAHQIACQAAKQIVKEGIDAGLSWTDIIISCESAVAIVVCATAELSGTPNRVQWVTEMVNIMTERAHGRAIAMIEGVPYEG